MKTNHIYITMTSLLFACFCYFNFNFDALENHDQSFADAEVLYQQNCSGCHGAKMQAFIDRDWKYGDTKEDMYESITQGRGKGAMPAFGKSLSQKQIESIVSYLQLGFKKLNYYEDETVFDKDAIFECLDQKFRLEIVTEVAEIPWGMTWLPDNSMLITDRSGKLYHLKAGKSIRVKNVPQVDSEGQGGLMDIEMHPDYLKKGWLYLSYSKRLESRSTTAVSRYKLINNALVDEEIIFEGTPYTDAKHHYGSRLEFDREGRLFLTMGDRGSREHNPQDLSVDAGKIHRINEDGSIPKDNPFKNGDGKVLSLFSFGHRNPQGLAVRPSTGELWSHEHGPRGGDEINVIRKGLNFGWPEISYGINYDGTTFTSITEKEGMEQPLHYWIPSIAPCGMDFVDSNLYPKWKGHLLVGSLRFEYLEIIVLEGQKVAGSKKLVPNIGRVRNVKQAPDGYIYLATEEPGKVYRIVPINE